MYHSLRLVFSEHSDMFIVFIERIAIELQTNNWNDNISAGVCYDEKSKIVTSIFLVFVFKALDFRVLYDSIGFAFLNRKIC